MKYSKDIPKKKRMQACYGGLGNSGRKRKYTRPTKYFHRYAIIIKGKALNSHKNCDNFKLKIFMICV